MRRNATRKSEEKGRSQMHEWEQKREGTCPQFSVIKRRVIKSLQSLHLCYSWNISLKAHFRRFFYLSLDTELRTSTIHTAQNCQPGLPTLPLMSFLCSVSHIACSFPLSRHLHCPDYWTTLYIQWRDFFSIFLQKYVFLNNLKSYTEIEPSSKIILITWFKPKEIEKKLEDLNISQWYNTSSFFWSKNSKTGNSFSFALKVITQSKIK